MKKIIAAAFAVAALAIPAVASAAPGGAPGAHGVQGPGFGQVVSGVATTLGGQCIAYHVQTGVIGGPCLG